VAKRVSPPIDRRNTPCRHRRSDGMADNPSLSHSRGSRHQVRVNHRVVSQAVVIATDVRADGWMVVSMTVALSTPYRIDVPAEAIADLRSRLTRTRWPRRLPAPDWAAGVPVDYLRMLVERWRTDYHWPTWQAGLNAYPQFRTMIDGQTIHFLHVRSPHADALPMLATHGWPGSIAEFLDVLGPLTDPTAHGGDARDAFHVVAPSVPGHGFSVPLNAAGWGHERIARAFVELMQRLDYPRYGTHGGDTGSQVSPLVARYAPDAVIGVHIHGLLGVPPCTAEEFAALGPGDQTRMTTAQQWSAEHSGYAQLQATAPQTLAFALADSPAGQLAWVTEKFRDWTDPAAELPEEAVSLDHLLTDVSIYWFTNTAATSANLYRENRLATPPTGGRSDVPTAVAVFPTDIAIRPLLERDHNIVRWTEYHRGGHFAALEAPDLLVDDLRAFFRPLRRPQT
jgi:epoxide hydrolase